MTPCNGICPTCGLREPGCALPARPQAAVLCAQMLSVSGVCRRRCVCVSSLWELVPVLPGCCPQAASGEGSPKELHVPVCVCASSYFLRAFIYTALSVYVSVDLQHFFPLSGIFSSCWFSPACGCSSPRCTTLAHSCLCPLSRLVVDAPAFDMGLGDCSALGWDAQGCSVVLVCRSPSSCPACTCTLCGHGAAVVPFLEHGLCVLTVRARPRWCLQTLS